jgi:endogenous inhibitor of DNA gyrase (YacG/DUF329 family)
MPEILVEECPFCKKSGIKVMHKEETFTARRKNIRAGRNTEYIRSPEKYEVVSDKCPNCGKPKKEIEKALAKGKELPNEEVVKRLREAGLDPSNLR